MKRLYEEVFDKPSGHVGIYLHKGGQFVNGRLIGGKMVEQVENHNLIVNSASNIMAGRMAPGAITGATDAALTGNFLDYGIQYLALGCRAVQDMSMPYDEVTNPVDTSQVDVFNPPPETLSTTKLGFEICRFPVTSWCFLDAVRNETDQLTNILKLQFQLAENEGNVPILELGLFGGDATSEINSGIMFNHKNVKLISKENTMRLTIIWVLTF